LLVETIKRLAEREEAGPAPSFTAIHLANAIWLIGSEKTVSRRLLCGELRLGEGAVKTLVKRLKDARLVATSKLGCNLTQRGWAVYNQLTSTLTKKTHLDNVSLNLGGHMVGVLVKNLGHRVRRGLEQRDAAVRAGALGAVTMVFRGGRLVMPGVSDVTSEHPEFAEEVVERFQPDENDVIVIVGADTRGKAEYGALAVAWSLLTG